MNKTFAFWLIALSAWIYTGLHFSNKYWCQNSSVLTSAASLIPAAGTSNSDLWTYNDGDLNVSSNHYFKFLDSKTDHLSLSDDVTTDLNETKNYLSTHKDRLLTITGYYKSSEKNGSVLENLGLARASHVKTYLSSLGYPASQLAIDSKLISDDNWFTSDTLTHGADFSFSGLTDNTARLAEIKKRLVGKPLTVYFATNQSNLDFTDQQRANFSDIIYYLDNVATSNINISGHTDNKGAVTMNTALSKNRAEFVKSYLVKNASIEDKRMQSEGFGPSKPIADNTSKEGKAKNRRVEITLN